MINMEGFNLWYSRVFLLIWISIVGYFNYRVIIDYSIMTIPVVLIGIIFFAGFVYFSRFIYFRKALYVVSEEQLQVNYPFKKIIQYDKITKVIYNDTIFQRKYISIYTDSTIGINIPVLPRRAKETYHSILKYSSHAQVDSEFNSKEEAQSILSYCSKSDKIILAITVFLWVAMGIVHILSSFIPSIDHLIYFVIVPLFPFHILSMIVLFKSGNKKRT